MARPQAIGHPIMRAPFVEHGTATTWATTAGSRTVSSHELDARRAAISCCMVASLTESNAMPLDIESPAVDRLARDLTAITGQSLTEVVRRSLAERLEHEADCGVKLQGRATCRSSGGVLPPWRGAGGLGCPEPHEIIGHDDEGKESW